MPIITKSGLDTVHALVRSENPSMPSGVTATNMRISNLQPVDSDRSKAVFSGRYGHGYRGQAEVKYFQLDLKILFGGKPLVIYVETPRSMHGQLADLAYYTGIQLFPNDVVDTPAPQSELPYETTLTASPTSAGYRGEIPIRFEFRNKRLDELAPWSDYDVAFAPYSPANTDRARGEYLTYGTDYTLSTAELKAMELGVLTTERATRLAAALTLVDAAPWTGEDKRGFWSLLGADVIYNGHALNYVAADKMRWANLRYSHVAVVDMIVDRGAGDLYGSQLFIHYNVME